MSRAEQGRDDRLTLSVVVVTYGERWSYLREVLVAVGRCEAIDAIVVVDNASSGYDLRAEVDRLALDVIVIGSGENLGSAGGFALGLEWVVEHRPDGFVLMLDDDNVPAPGAVDAVATTVLNASDASTCWLMRRTSRPEVARLIDGGRPVCHSVDSYAGFSVRAKLVEFGRGRREAAQPDDRLEYAPYGGLAMPVRMVAAAGPPRSDYFLYADDHEFTTRIVRKAGAVIRLHPTAELVDVDTSWHLRSRTIIGSVDPHIDAFRAYYATRNRHHLERMWLRRHRAERWLNAATYWTAVAVDAVALLTRGAGWNVVRDRVALLRRANADARAGRLGRRPDVEAS